MRSVTADGTVVAFGDSITDGYHSTIGSNERWPNYLARRLDALLGDRAPGVVDEGISGNRVLQGSPCYGDSAKARFQRDVLSQPGVKAVIVLEGTNDFGFVGLAGGGCYAPNPPVTAAQIEAGYQALISMAHDHGVKVYLGTLVPPPSVSGPGPKPATTWPSGAHSTPGSRAAAHSTGASTSRGPCRIPVTPW